MTHMEQRCQRGVGRVDGTGVPLEEMDDFVDAMYTTEDGTEQDDNSVA